MNTNYMRREIEKKAQEEYKRRAEADFITGRILAMNPTAKWEMVHAEVLQLLKPNN